MTYESYYVFSGRTYFNRDMLNCHGCGATWNPAAKVWMLCGRLLEKTVINLRRAGVKVEVTRTAPDVWNEFYGLDEDDAEEIAPNAMIDITSMSDADLDALLGAA